MRWCREVLRILLIFVYFLDIFGKLFTFLDVAQLLNGLSAVLDLGEGKDAHGEVADEGESLAGLLVGLAVGDGLGLVLAHQVVRLLQRLLVPQQSLLVLFHYLRRLGLQIADFWVSHQVLLS